MVFSRTGPPTRVGFELHLNGYCNISGTICPFRDQSQLTVVSGTIYIKHPCDNKKWYQPVSNAKHELCCLSVFAKVLLNMRANEDIYYLSINNNSFKASPVPIIN
jgi:hypothetical protein